MLVLYKNINQNGDLFIGEVITSYENFLNQGYIDVLTSGDNCGSVQEQNQDWKNSYINCVSRDDIVCFAETHNNIENKFPEFFI